MLDWWRMIWLARAVSAERRFFHLNDLLLRLRSGGFDYRVLDELYYTVPQDLWSSIIAMDWLPTKQWLRDLYDCDNFAFHFKTRIETRWKLNAVGCVFAPGHAFNVVVLPDMSLAYLEPQNGLWIEPQLDASALVLI